MHRASCTGGDWEYAFNDSFDRQTKQYKASDKFGSARIVQTPELIVLTGESRVDKNQDSIIIATFQGEGFGVVNDQIELTINFVGRSGAARGFMILNIVTTPTKWWRIIPPLPQRIDGFYYLFGFIKWPRYAQADQELSLPH